MKLLLLFLKAICRGYKPTLEALLFDGILWHDEFVIVEACLVFGGGYVIIILRLSICRSLWRAGLSILLSQIVLEEIVAIFDTIRSVIISYAGITTFALAELRVVPLTSALGLLLGGVILHYLVAIAFFGCIHHVYIV